MTDQLVIPAAIVLLVLSIIMTAYSASRKENRLPKLTFMHGVLISVTYGLFIAGTIMLFIATGWRWGLAGLGISWLVMLVVGARTGAPKYVDRLLVRRVHEISTAEEQHRMELEAFWNSTSPEGAGNLMVNFLDELRCNWPREYSQLNPATLPDAVSKDFKSSIVLAYKAGYMRGRGWISQKHLVDFSLYLGDKLADEVKQAFKNVRSRGNAFASGYVAVAVRGHLKALEKTATRE